MNSRKIVISTLTSDIGKSTLLYRDALGLAMRPPCNPIAMFPLGDVELQVCAKQASEDLIGVDFSSVNTCGVAVTLSLGSFEALEVAERAALRLGCESRPTKDASKERCFLDFNGVTWLLTF